MSPSSMNPIGWLLSHAERLRFPQLLVLVGFLFVLDFFVIDPIPFLDELILGLLTLLFGVWRRDPPIPVVDVKPPEKDVTPPSSEA